MKNRKSIKLSLIVPFYNEEKMVDIFFETVIPIVKKISNDYEIICVNDSFADTTFELLKKWHFINNKIKVLTFSRNFGKEAAMTAGVDYCTGDAAVFIDADLQDPPQELSKMVEKWKEGFDVVLMKRLRRNKDSFFKRVTAYCFYRIINFMSHKMVEKDVSDFRLLDRKVLDVLKCLKEKNRFMKGLMSWSGFKKCDLYFERPARIKGKTKFNCSKMIRLVFDGIFSFSIMPIRLFTLLGILLSSISFIWIFYIIYQKLYLGDVVSGWASIMSVILFFNGVVMIGLGILGEYVGRVYNEVKDRPIYVVDQELF